MKENYLFEKTEILVPITEDKVYLDNMEFEKKVNSNETQFNMFYDEEFLYETLKKDFDDQIVKRGKDYYCEGNVLEVYKNKNTYIAKVDGNSMDPYSIKIIINNENKATYECSCPCDFPCKHEYAVLMAIADNNYLEVELKEFIKENKIEINNLIQQIPAEELKNYLLMKNGLVNFVINENNFYDYFRKYLPKQSYKFYYNNLYNELVTKANYRNRIENYILRARQYLECSEFNEVFIIIKAIIEAYNDVNQLNYNNYIFEVISRASMLLRIAYRKAIDVDKTNLDNWIKKLIKNNYYNNYYLEDLILGLK